MNPICGVSQAPWTGTSSLLFGTWRGLGFATAVMRKSFFVHDILADLQRVPNDDQGR
jgi:hypothetical protein